MNLRLRAYKIQLMQKLKLKYHQAQDTFGEWVKNKIASDLDFHKQILLSYEAYSWFFVVVVVAVR